MCDYDIAIVGAGVVGSCTAREFARDHDVLLVEKGQIAGSAAGHAAGFISDWWAHEGSAFPESHRIITEFFREFDGTSHFTFTERPFLTFVDSRSDVDEWRMEHGDLPHGFEFLSPAEIEDAWPGLFDLSAVAGAVVDENAGFVDPHTFTVTLAKEAEKRGADVRTNSEVTDILTDGDAVSGIEIAGEETVSAATVIVTAGTFTRDLVSEYVDLPTRSFIFSNAQLLVNGELRDDFPMILVDGVYCRPEHGSNLFVSGGEYWLSERTRAPTSVPSGFRTDVAQTLLEFLNDTDGLEYMPESEHTCPAGTAVAPDFTPIIDRLNQPDGLLVVDGVFGGIATAPAYAAALRALVTEFEPPFPLDPFRVDRFESTAIDFDFEHIDELP